MVWRNVMDTSGPTAWHRTYRNGTSKIKQACHRPHDHQTPFQRLESRMQVPRLNPVLVFQMQCSWPCCSDVYYVPCGYDVTTRHNTSQHVTTCHNMSQHVTTCHHSFWTCYIMLHHVTSGLWWFWCPDTLRSLSNPGVLSRWGRGLLLGMSGQQSPPPHTMVLFVRPGGMSIPPEVEGSFQLKALNIIKHN